MYYLREQGEPKGIVSHKRNAIDALDDAYPDADESLRVVVKVNDGPEQLWKKVPKGKHYPGWYRTID